MALERGKRTYEGFQNTSPAKVHYYWIVSDKRKPMVLQQIQTRGGKMSEHYTIEPPVALEDNPTFGTLLDHTWNAGFYKTMIQTYNRDEYFKYRT